MNTLLFLLAAMIAQAGLEFPAAELSMRRYPETVMPGDTIYIQVVAKNPHDESIDISDRFRSGRFRTRIRDSENQTQLLLFEGSRIIRDYLPVFVAIKPGDSRIIGALAINVPPLEDLTEPFWEKHLKELAPDGKQFVLETEMFLSSFPSVRDSAESAHQTITLIMPPDFFRQRAKDRCCPFNGRWPSSGCFGQTGGRCVTRAVWAVLLANRAGCS